MNDDAELLRCYAENRSEDAFAELVRRHVNLVHSVALRQVNGDAHLAADVTQAVFTDLARKAPSLVQHRVLAGWLFTSARFAAAKAVRTEQRRHAREQEAHLMEELTRDPSSLLEWERVRPVLDEVIGELAEPDREVILLRFFEGRDFASIGARLELNANTARMRVERALDKLRGRLARRGVTSTSAALATVLANQAVVAAPAGLALVVTGAALSGGGALAIATATGGTAATGAGLATFMSMTKLQIGLASAITVAGAAGFAVQAESESNLRREMELLRSQNTQAAAARTENEQLRRTAAEAAELRNDDAELNRLRDEAKALKIKLQAMAVASAPTPAAGVSGELFDISKLDRQPVPRLQAPPQYPSEMRLAGISGEAVVDFIVDANGDVQKAYAIRSSQKEFEAAAVDAINKWKFKPGLKNARNVNTHMQVPIVFTLSEGAGAGTSAPKTVDANPLQPGTSGVVKLEPYTVVTDRNGDWF